MYTSTVVGLLVVVLTGCATPPERRCEPHESLLKTIAQCGSVRPASAAHKCMANAYYDTSKQIQSCYETSEGVGARINLMEAGHTAFERSRVWFMWEQGKIDTFQRETLLQGVR